jgi:hypothetical protein
MGKTDFYRKVGMAADKGDIDAPPQLGEEVSSLPSQEAITNSSNCPSCGEPVDWDSLEIKRRKKPTWFPLDFSPIFGLAESEVERYRECPSCRHTEIVGLEGP